jgi:methionyl-tRNA formyltransferase
MKKPSVILLGSKPGSVVALELLLERGWDVRYVVTSQHDYSWIEGPNLATFARARGLTVVSQKELPDDAKATFVLSYMFRYLVKARTRAMGERAALNFHAGPLPRFGGWAFYNVALLEGASEYGCTCHHMDDGFDTGPLLKVRTFPIESELETAVSLERKTQAEMIRLFCDFCMLAESTDVLPTTPQDPTLMRYMTQEQFTKLKEIPPGADGETQQRIARAFWYPPYECAYVNTQGGRLEVMPSIAKTEIASHQHGDDLTILRAAARTYVEERAANAGLVGAGGVF